MEKPKARRHGIRAGFPGLLFPVVVVLALSMHVPRAGGHWNPPGAPVLEVATAGPTVLVQWKSSWQDWGYYFHYAPMDLSYVEQVYLGTQRHLAVDLWDGAAFFVAATGYNDSGSGDYSNIGVVEIDYPPPLRVVVPDTGDVLLDVVEAMAFGSATYSGVPSADGVRVAINSVRAWTPSGEMTVTFDNDGAPSSLVVGGKGIVFTFRGDAVGYELLGDGKRGVVKSVPGERQGDLETILRGLAADRVVAAVAKAEGAVPRWLEHIGLHPFHGRITANADIMVLVEVLFTTRAMRHRLSMDVCSAETAPGACEVRKGSAREALETLIAVIEETLEVLIGREWAAYTDLAFPIAYGGVAGVEATFYGPSGGTATCFGEIPVNVVLLPDGTMTSRSSSYHVDTAQNFGYAESCSIVMEPGIADHAGSHDSSGNFSFRWGESFVAGVNFTGAVYGNGYLEIEGPGVEQSITFVLQRTE